MKRKRIWFKNRIGKEVWQDRLASRFIPGLVVGVESGILTKITITRQNMESLYISQTDKKYKYYDI